MWRPLLPPAGDETDELGGGEWLLGSISKIKSNCEINERLSKVHTKQLFAPKLE